VPPQRTWENDPVTATEALLALSAVHAGFQLVVSVVVYPALADVPP